MAEVQGLRCIGEALTENGVGEDLKLQAVCNLKKIFKPPDKIFQYVNIESLLENGWISLQYKTPEKDFLLKYGTSLVDFMGKDSSFDSKILHHLSFVSAELKKQDETLANVLATKLWRRFENEAIFPKEFLSVLKEVIEGVVVDWIEDTSLMEVQARMAAGSPELFQALTSILYQMLVKSGGHWRALEVAETFVRSVLSLCQKEGMDFLKLYPKDYRRLVSLLMVPPDVYSEEEGVSKKMVGKLLMDLFWEDHNGALILLSHYPQWMIVLKLYLNESYNHQTIFCYN